MSKILEYELDRDGSSEYENNILGMSAMQTLVDCPKKFVTGVQLSQDPDRPFEIHWNGMSVGTICHAFADLYHTGQLTETTQLPSVTFVGPSFIEERVIIEAIRVFTWYMTHVPPDAYGEVISGEEHIKLSQDQTNELFGQEMPVRFAIKLDLLVCSMTNGKGIIDHKFLAQNRSDANSRYGDSLQAVGYSEAVKLVLGDLEFMKFNTVIKTKVPKQFIFDVDVSDRRWRLERFGKAFNICYDQMQQGGELTREKYECPDCWVRKSGRCSV